MVDRQLIGKKISPDQQGSVKGQCKILPFLLLTLTLSCSKNEPAPSTGCWTGMLGTKRILISCCEQKTYLAGNNVQAGGISWAANYKQWEYEAGKTCRECEEKYK